MEKKGRDGEIESYERKELIEKFGEMKYSKAILLLNGGKRAVSGIVFGGTLVNATWEGGEFDIFNSKKAERIELIGTLEEQSYKVKFDKELKTSDGIIGIYSKA